MPLVAPTNPQQYDLASSINSGVATLVGILFGTLAYILIFPPDPRAARQYVTYRIRRGLELVSLMKPLPPTNSHWETRMYDRIMRLVDPQNPSGTPTDEWLDAGLGALTLGNGILRLRRRLANEEMAADVRLSGERMIEAFNEFLPEPKRVTGILTSEIRRLEQIDPGQGAPLRRGVGPGAWQCARDGRVSCRPSPIDYAEAHSLTAMLKEINLDGIFVAPFAATCWPPW